MLRGANNLGEATKMPPFIFYDNLIRIKQNDMAETRYLKIIANSIIKQTLKLYLV